MFAALRGNQRHKISGSRCNVDVPAYIARASCGCICMITSRKAETRSSSPASRASRGSPAVEEYARQRKVCRAWGDAAGEQREGSRLCMLQPSHLQPAMHAHPTCPRTWNSGVSARTRKRNIPSPLTGRLRADRRCDDAGRRRWFGSARTIGRREPCRSRPCPGVSGTGKENTPARTPAGVRPGGNDGRADRARLASDRREASLPFCRQFPMPQTVCRGEPTVGNQDRLSEIAQSIPPMSTGSRQARQSEHSHDHDQAFALSAGLRLTRHGSGHEKRVDDLEGKDSFRSGPLNGPARLRKTVVGREAHGMPPKPADDHVETMELQTVHFPLSSCAGRLSSSRKIRIPISPTPCDH